MSLAAIVSTSCAAFLSLSVDAQGDKPLEVRMGSFSKAVDYAPYLVAKNKKWFERDLAKVSAKPTYTTFQTLPSINESFAGKHVDAVFEAEIPALIGKSAGLGLKINDLSCALKVQVVGQKALGFKGISDLKGKKVAVLAGTSAHYGLMNCLTKAGLGKKDVSILNMTPPDAKSAFETKKVDAWAVWPPFVQQEQLAGFGEPLPGVESNIVVVMAVREDFIKEHKEAYAAIKKVLAESRRWVDEHPAEAQEIVAKELDIPVPVVKLAWPVHNWNASLNDAMIADFQKKAQFLKDQGYIKTTMDVKQLVSSTN